MTRPETLFSAPDGGPGNDDIIVVPANGSLLTTLLLSLCFGREVGVSMHNRTVGETRTFDAHEVCIPVDTTHVRLGFVALVQIRYFTELLVLYLQIRTDKDLGRRYEQKRTC